MSYLIFFLLCILINTFYAFRNFRVVFALLPAQCAVCVGPVLCLLNVLPAQFAMRGYNKSSYYYYFYWVIVMLE